jgi:hypothetical protein
MAKWLDKYEQGGQVLKKKTKDNYGKKPNPNDVDVSIGPDFVGMGNNTKGRNYSPAWGGQFEMGGSMPGSVGFMYARVAGAAPNNGKYAKKTKASAQNGEVLPAPRYNAQGKKYLYDTDDPAFKDLVEGDITPVNKSEFNPIRNKISDYVLSDTYLNRLKNFVPDPRFAKRVQLARAHQTLNTNIKSIDEYVKPKNVVNDMPNTSRYDYTTNTVYYTPGEDTRGALAHETGHSLFNSSTDEKNTNSALFLNPAERQAILEDLDVEGLNKLINSNPNLSWMAQDEHYNPGAKGEKIASNETYGDLMSLRLLLNDNGITKKFGDDITPEMWQKALKNPKINKSPDLKRMRLKYKDDALIKMNNRVAKNDAIIPNPNVEELIPIAQNGLKAQSGAQMRKDVLSRDVYDMYDPNSSWKGMDPKAMKERLEWGPKWKQYSDDARSMSQSDWLNKHWVLASAYDGTYRDKIKYLKDQYKEYKNYEPYTEDQLTKTKNELDAYTKWEQGKQQYFEGLAAQKAAEQKKINEERTGKQKFISDYSAKQEALKKLAETFGGKYGFIPGEQLGGDAHKMLVKKMIDEANQAIESGIGYNLFQDPKSEMTCINGVCTIAANAGVDFSQMANALGVVKDPEGRYIPQSNIGWAEKDAYKKAGFRKLALGEVPQEGDFAQYGDDGRLHHMELVLGTSPEGITTYNNYGQTLTPVPGAGKEQRKFKKGTYNTEDFQTTQYFRLDPKVEEAIAVKSPEYTKKAEAKKKLESSDEYKQYLEYQKFLEGNKGQYEEYKKALEQKQNGGEMSFYQNGLDFKPKSISKNGKVIKDDLGQWAHPGEVTEIGSPDITMQGVNYPVLGISDTGDTQMMEPGKNYKFKGKKVTEYPMAQKGKKLTKEQLKQNIDKFLADQKPFYDKLMAQDKQFPSIDEMAENAQNSYQNFKGDNTRIVRNAPDMRTAQQKKDQEAIMDAQRKKWAANKKLKQSERYSNTQKKGNLNDPDSWHIADKMRLFPNSIGGAGELFDDYLNPFTFVGSMADALGSSVARRDPKGAALSLGLAAGAGALGFDPLGSALKVPLKVSKKVAQSMESGLLSKAWNINPSAEKLIGKTQRQTFGDPAYESFLKYGPTTQPEVSAADQLAQWNKLVEEASPMTITRTGENMQVAGTTRFDNSGMRVGTDYPFAYFSEGSPWYGPKASARMAEALGVERRIVPKQGSNLDFYPAGESSVVVNPGELSKEAIQTYAGRRRVLSPFGEAFNPEAFDVYKGKPHWWKGYQKEVPPINKNKIAGSVIEGDRKIFYNELGDEVGSIENFPDIDAQRNINWGSANEKMPEPKTIPNPDYTDVGNKYLQNNDPFKDKRSTLKDIPISGGSTTKGPKKQNGGWLNKYK